MSHSGYKWHTMVDEWGKVGGPMEPNNPSKNMLIGEHTHTFDGKFRVALPSRFRAVLGKKIVLTRGLDECVFLFSAKEWSRIAKELGAMGMTRADSRGFGRFMLAGAIDLDIDASGRILVPEHLRQFAHLVDTVVFAGVYNRVELWNKDRWSDYQKGVVSQADALAEKLGEIGAL
jgi:MraZ protein